MLNYFINRHQWEFFTETRKKIVKTAVVSLAVFFYTTYVKTKRMRANMLWTWLNLKFVGLLRIPWRKQLLAPSGPKKAPKKLHFQKNIKFLIFSSLEALSNSLKLQKSQKEDKNEKINAKKIFKKNVERHFGLFSILLILVLNPYLLHWFVHYQGFSNF